MKKYFTVDPADPLDDRGNPLDHEGLIRFLARHKKKKEFFAIAYLPYANTGLHDALAFIVIDGGTVRIACMRHERWTQFLPAEQSKPFVYAKCSLDDLVREIGELTEDYEKALAALMAIARGKRRRGDEFESLTEAFLATGAFKDFESQLLRPA